ncbi:MULTISPECIES: hypothetical protein [Sphingobacterium]|uniref:hypothetical protein n=1 Tax=Sphingobacterium TaxID=28453 RepID=UPI0028A6A51A|nr:hypothetical protein [Sphingobacterium multivorum]
METKIINWSLNGDLSVGYFEGLKMAYDMGLNRARSKSLERKYPEMVEVSFIEVYVRHNVLARVDVRHMNELQIEQEKRRLSDNFQNNCSLAHYRHYQEEGFKLDYFEEVI